MEFKPYDIHRLKNVIKESQKILLLSHRRPDPDTLGAVLSMNRVLRNMGKKTTLACHDPINIDWYFLPEVYLYVQDFGKVDDYDLIIALDCGDSNITDYHKNIPNIWTSPTPVINIDHHKTNDNFGNINIVKTTAASATQILYFLFEKLGWPIDHITANLMMAGLSFDTGHFQHDNTNHEVLFVASKLVEKGAKPYHIAKQIFKNIPVPTLKVWGKALARTKVNSHSVVSSIMTSQDVQESNANTDNLKSSELVSYINGVPDTKFALLLSEKDGLVKGSMRTQREDIDVAKIANTYFNGGGHKKAAGFAIKGKLHIDGFERRSILSQD